jgi:hypothetical protein
MIALPHSRGDFSHEMASFVFKAVISISKIPFLTIETTIHDYSDRQPNKHAL